MLEDDQLSVRLKSWLGPTECSAGVVAGEGLRAVSRSSVGLERSGEGDRTSRGGLDCLDGEGGGTLFGQYTGVASGSPENIGERSVGAAKHKSVRNDGVGE